MILAWASPFKVRWTFHSYKTERSQFVCIVVDGGGLNTAKWDNL